MCDHTPLCPSCLHPCTLIAGAWMCCNDQCETLMIRPDYRIAPDGEGREG